MARYEHPPVPFTCALPYSFHHEHKIIIRGHVEHHGGERFSINLYTGFDVAGHHRDNIALHINPRFDQDTIVLNHLHNDNWGTEERHQLHHHLFHKGHDFELHIHGHHNHLKIKVNGHELADFHHRIPMDHIRVLHVEGCVKLHHVSFE